IRLYFELRERGIQQKAESEQQPEKQTSRLYDTLGGNDGTNYEAFTEAETGDEMGTSATVSG
ncbi:MAG: hypothetical protein PUG85_03940, partial [Oscillospiraceae bacterium]|nr:hypothetical protein [Oscillospiraceae bacterium]